MRRSKEPLEKAAQALELAKRGIAVFVGGAEAEIITGFSRQQLKRIRLGIQPSKTPLIEGIHWSRSSVRNVRYNALLLADWAANRGNPTQHQMCVDRYLASLPSNQPARAGRKAG